MALCIVDGLLDSPPAVLKSCSCPGRLAQRESVPFTRERSEVQSLQRPPAACQVFQVLSQARSDLPTRSFLQDLYPCSALNRRYPPFSAGAATIPEVYLIRKASFFSFLAFISSLIHTGVAPRPAQVRFGSFLLRYLGATFRP